MSFRLSLMAVAAVACAALSPALAQHQHHAHTHGVVALDVAVDQNTITLELDAPLESLVGFERAPRTDAEKQRVQQAVERLKAAATLFTIDPAAQCQLKGVELESDVLGLGDKPAASTGAPAAAKGHSHGKKEHAHEEHADLEGRFVFACAQAASARYVDVGLFTAFSRIRTVNAQVASPAGQAKRTLRKDSARLTWGR